MLCNDMHDYCVLFIYLFVTLYTASHIDRVFVLYVCGDMSLGIANHLTILISHTSLARISLVEKKILTL